jgi:GGDEF domain-containing protein
LKALHSNLKHLTWQTKQIASGDYGQKVDFMGDYSESFNTMTRKLYEREKQLKEEIEEREKIQKQLEFFAFSDPLTGLSNRRTGLIVLKKAIDAGLLHKKPLSVCFIDVDGLKYVNDTYGHDEGDFLITTISDVLKSSVRSSDSIKKLIDDYDRSPSDWLSVVSRLGGDEFILVLPDCDFDTSEIVMNRILRKIEEKNAQIDKPYKLSISYGITSTDKELFTNVDDLINSADAKMYEQKLKKRATRV